MQSEKFVTFFSHRKRTIVDIDAILYAVQDGSRMKIHTSGGETYETRLPLHELETEIGYEFIKIKRNTLVRASAIEAVADSVVLKNGDTLPFSTRKKQWIIDELIKRTTG